MAQIKYFRIEILLTQTKHVKFVRNISEYISKKPASFFVFQFSMQF